MIEQLNYEQNELNGLRPIVVTFKGKPREVHFFHRGTSELFLTTLKGVSGSESMKRHKQREICLLSIVLADLNGSGRYLKRLKRWIWRKRLEHSTYSDVEAVRLLNAAKERIQDGKRIEALCAILLAQIQTIIVANKMSKGIVTNNTHKED